MPAFLNTVNTPNAAEMPSTTAERSEERKYERRRSEPVDRTATMVDNLSRQMDRQLTLIRQSQVQMMNFISALLNQMQDMLADMHITDPVDMSPIRSNRGARGTRGRGRRRGRAGQPLASQRIEEDNYDEVYPEEVVRRVVSRGRVRRMQQRNQDYGEEGYLDDLLDEDLDNHPEEDL